MIQQELYKHLGQPDDYLIAPAAPAKAKGRRTEMRKTTERLMKQVGLPGQNPFQRLRISYATIKGHEGESVFLVSSWLGHASVNTTQQYYMASPAQPESPSAEDPDGRAHHSKTTERMATLWQQKSVSKRRLRKNTAK